jgi:hypothetical protein
MLTSSHDLSLPLAARRAPPYGGPTPTKEMLVEPRLTLLTLGVRDVARSRR